MRALLDVNLLVALAWPNHVHHEAAHAWFASHQARGWATSPSTQSGFVRVSSNSHVIPGARLPSEAIAILRKMVLLEHHEFWTDDVSIVGSRWIAANKLMGYRQVTDAHLIALAIHRGGRFATIDRAARELLPDGAEPSRIVLVPT